MIYKKKIWKMLCSRPLYNSNPTFAFGTILQALVGRRAISVEYENNFYYVLMTYIMSSDKWKIFSIRYTVSTEPNVIFIRFTLISDNLPHFTLYLELVWQWKRLNVEKLILLLFYSSQNITLLPILYLMLIKKVVIIMITISQNNTFMKF